MSTHQIKPVSIAIDTVFFQFTYSGITRVWKTLFKNLRNNKNNTDYQITILQRESSINKFKLEQALDTKFNIIKINDFNYMTMNQDVDYINHLCKMHNFDVFISTYYTYCTVIPNILLIHDMIPEHFNFVKNHMWKQKHMAIMNASSFITISKTTKNDLIKFYPHIEDNKDLYPITTIYNAIVSNKQSIIYDDTLLTVNHIRPKSYIFIIATNNEAYKNTVLITNLGSKYGSRLSNILKSNIPIIMICKTNLQNGYKVENNILYLSHVSNATLNSLYKNALCFVCPSLYEGFGLTIFEAYMHSLPVIAIKNPVFEELSGGGIHYIENNIESLYDKIFDVVNNDGNSISSRINFGLKQLEKFTETEQISKYDELFSNIKKTILEPKPFINLIIQSYNETNSDRRAELKYCLQQNLNNPYIKSIHDFVSCSYSIDGGIDGGIDDDIDNFITSDDDCIFRGKMNNSHKYIKVSNPSAKWMTFEMAITYANTYSRNMKNRYINGCAAKPIPNYNYWCIVNLDIFLDNASQWNCIKGQLNNGYVYAQSRHEFTPSGSKLDENFSKMFHANTQDAWLFKTPLEIGTCKHNSCNYETYETYDTFENECCYTKYSNSNKKTSYDFEIGFLGCDNAIADRMYKSGYKIINQPSTYKIFHYDIAKGKTSLNYMEKHSTETKDMLEKNIKPKNKYPERIGSYLVPNYDQMLDGKQEIDFIGLIRNLGGCSNWERYEFISKLFSEKILIQNP